MDTTVVIAILVILLLAAGGGAYAYHAVARPLAAAPPGGSRLGRGQSVAVLEPGSAADGTRAVPALADVGGLRAEVDRLRAETRATAAEIDAGLGRLRDRRDAVLADAEKLATRVRDELARAEEARRVAEAAAERERQREHDRSAHGGEDDVIAPGARAERAETVAELFRRLTRVEMTLAALTAPILLPGEPYAVPDEFPPEALRWENWKEVGESAYALGDYFHGRRLHLDPATATAVTACLTTLRVALTEQVYPNLKPLPTREDADALRGGLTRIAEEVTSVCSRLEGEYRTLAGTSDLATAKA